MKIFNLSCKKCSKIKMLRILWIYALDAFGKLTQSFPQQFKQFLCVLLEIVPGLIVVTYQLFALNAASVSLLKLVPFHINIKALKMADQVQFLF